MSRAFFDECVNVTVHVLNQNSRKDTKRITNEEYKTRIKDAFSARQKFEDYPVLFVKKMPNEVVQLDAGQHRREALLGINNERGKGGPMILETVQVSASISHQQLLVT